MENKATKRQHYVYREYLRSWANEKDQIWCCIDNEKLVKTNLMNVAQGNCFYKKSEPFNQIEKQLLYKMAKDSETEILKNTQIELIDIYDNINHIYQFSKIISPNNNNIQIENLSKQTEESIQSLIEKVGFPYLKKLQRKDISFLKDEKERMQLYIFVAEQFSRTKKVRDDLSNITIQFKDFIDVSKILNPLCHIASQKIACIFLAENYHVVLLENNSNKNFITGDQPVINTLADGFLEKRMLEYYYPISPKVAILISKSAYYTDDIIINVDEKKVESYNTLIKKESQKFLFAKNELDFE